MSSINEYPYSEKVKLYHEHYQLHKWTPNELKLRPETIKLVEENNRKDFKALESVSIVLGETPSAQEYVVFISQRKHTTYTPTLEKIL